MSSNATFISSSNQKRWIQEIDTYFSKEHTVDIDSEYPTCVFRVPKSLTETKPEAYAPPRLGLGPYHHLRPEFYDTQKLKISAVKRFLGQAEKLHHVFSQVVATLTKSELVVRACYDQYLDFHIETLARILAIDVLYLLQFFEGGKKNDQDSMAGDVIMLENQIPVVLLEKLREVLASNKICEPPGSEEHVLSQEFRSFCQAHSPFELELELELPHCLPEQHLLHRMYHLIVCREGLSQGAGASFEEFTEDVGTCLECLGVPGAALPGQILAIAERVKRILGRFKKEEVVTPSVEGIDIPTVSEMNETAGIKFKGTDEGMEFIGYECEEKIFCLPSIRLDANSEVVLRNLIAFEAAATKTGSTECIRLWPHMLASYVDLMCGIIETKKDVDILKKAGIIRGELPDEEIVRIFNGMRKSTGGNYKLNPNVKEAIDDVNKEYNDLGRVKATRCLKKCCNASWKTISVSVAVVVVLLLTLQALCSAFGCARWFGKSSTVQGFHFLYADQ